MSHLWRRGTLTDARRTRCRHHIIISRPIGDVKTVFNVAVTAHHPRNDLLQAGAVTASGILLRLGQQGETVQAQACFL